MSTATAKPAEIPVEDAELMAIMAELEAANVEIMKDAAVKTPEPAPVVEAPPFVPTTTPVLVDKVAPPPAPEPVVVVPQPTLTGPAVTVNLAPPAPVEPPPVVIPIVVQQPAAPAAVKPGLQYYVDVNQFRVDTRVTEASLDQCMIEQNGLRAFYGSQAAMAEAQASRLDIRFEVVEATLYDKHRKLLAAADPTAKVTEKMVENAVKMDPAWLRGHNTVIEAQSIAGINKALVESLKDRRDMIIQLGADRRDEYKGAARTMAVKEETTSARGRAEAAVQMARGG